MKLLQVAVPLLHRAGSTLGSLLILNTVGGTCIHGYDSSNEIVIINARLYDNCIDIEVIDYGKGIEDVSLPGSPSIPPNLSWNARYGLYSNGNFMDKVEVSSAPGQGTKVRMINTLALRILKRREYEHCAGLSGRGQGPSVYEETLALIDKAQKGDKEAEDTGTKNTALISIVKSFLTGPRI